MLRHSFLGSATFSVRLDSRSIFPIFGAKGRISLCVLLLTYHRLVFAFMSKEACENLLANENPGVFIIRFSDSRPGLFALAYVSTTTLPKSTQYEVKHYLVNTQGK